MTPGNLIPHAESSPFTASLSLESGRQLRLTASHLCTDSPLPPHLRHPQSSPVFFSPPQSSTVLLSPPQSSSILPSPPQSSSVLLSPPRSSTALPNPPRSSPVLRSPPGHWLPLPAESGSTKQMLASRPPQHHKSPLHSAKSMLASWPLSPHPCPKLPQLMGYSPSLPPFSS